MPFEIKHRFSCAVLFALETDNFKTCVEAAVKARANLAGADLTCADKQKLTLVGAMPVLTVGPIGSRSATLTAYVTDAGAYVRTGCFWDTLDAFRAAVTATHGDNKHGREYRAAIALIEIHAAIWTPATPITEAA